MIVIRHFKRNAKLCCIDPQSGTWSEVHGTDSGLGQPENPSGIWDEVKCGVWPFSRHKHFAALYVFDGALWLQFDARRFDLGKAEVQVRVLDDRRRFLVPMRTFFVEVAGTTEVECRYFYVDTFREGWPDNDDIRSVVVNAARNDSMKRRTMYVWRCSQLGKPVDYALLARIEAGEIKVVPGL